MTQTTMKVPYNYLQDQFQVAPAARFTKYAEAERGRHTRTNDILHDIYDLVETGDYTLGEPVRRFEEAFAQKLRVKHAIGVSNGTDALFLALKAIGIKSGDEVVTVPNSFIATTGAILQAGATPVFLDVGDDYLMGGGDEPIRISGRTFLPVDLTGNVCPFIGNNVIHDAAQAIGAEYDGQSVATLGDASCFSLHPLKNVNVWGDGGVITTNDAYLAERLRRLRNHGLEDRDKCVMPGYNHRLSSIQAIVAYHVLQDLDWITETRIAHAKRYDEGLKDVLTVPPRDPATKQVYHTYVVQAKRRDALIAYMGERGIEAKVHYPIPIHLQPGYKHLGFKKGDFPVAEAQAKRILSLPIHQYLTEDQIDYVIDTIQGFYAGA